MFDGTSIEIGLVATTMALVLAIVAFVFAGLGAAPTRRAGVAVARLALYGNVVLVAAAIAVIIAAFVRGDFSVYYVSQHSNSQLPFIYRITAMWGAHEGSLMLWLFFLVIFSALAAFLHRRRHQEAMPYVLMTLAGIQIGFLSFILFLSSPFIEIQPPFEEGRDLNPLLQDPGLIFHPPLLYLGYVGFSVPFAFAIAALVRGETGPQWIIATRRWTLFAWLALTSGIMLGGYWSYYELGWGGYWAWDPVENASLMPWLTATAFVHSVMAQERRELFRVWNLFLIIATFSLSLMGTFLVRSGVLTSVHAFAVDPGRGSFILAFLAIVLVTGFGLLIFRAERLRGSEEIVSLVSRESALLYNNLFLLVAFGAVFVGTLLPLFAAFFTDNALSVAAPYFNQVMTPLMLGLLLLMALGPVVPWRRASARLLRRQFVLPAVASILVAAGAMAFGIREWIAVAATAVLAFVVLVTVIDIIRASRVRAAAAGRSALWALGDLMRMNPRRYGGLVVHLGIVVIGIGLVGSGVFREAVTIAVAPGDRFVIGDYLVTYRGIDTVQGPNYTARQTRFSVSREGAPWAELVTEKRNFPRGEMVTTEAAIRSTFWEDLYLVHGGEAGDGRVSVQAFRNPLVSWIWAGWFIIALGTAVSLSPRRYERTTLVESYA